MRVGGGGCGGSLTQLGMVAVLPQADILYIQEPKGLNFKGGGKTKKNDICKISVISTVHFCPSVHTTPFQPLI